MTQIPGEHAFAVQVAQKNPQDASATAELAGIRGRCLELESHTTTLSYSRSGFPKRFTEPLRLGCRQPIDRSANRDELIAKQ